MSLAPASSGLPNKAASDTFAWFLNVSTSVLIVFVNKLLMDPKFGYKFVFGKKPSAHRLHEIQTGLILVSSALRSDNSVFIPLLCFRTCRLGNRGFGIQHTSKAAFEG